MVKRTLVSRRDIICNVGKVSNSVKQEGIHKVKQDKSRGVLKVVKVIPGEIGEKGETL